MPISGYNPQFGGAPSSASKAKSAIEKEYGAGKGDSVFYALVNKRKKAAQATGQAPVAGKPMSGAAC